MSVRLIKKRIANRKKHKKNSQIQHFLFYDTWSEVRLFLCLQLARGTPDLTIKTITMDRKTRKEYKEWGKGYYHLCLDRLEGRLLFNDDEDYRLGMATVALAKLKCGIEVYAVELMPNHFHEILSGTGEQCLKVFAYLKRRFSEQLIKKGYPPLPEDYGFKLIPIEDEEAMRKQILYTVRNPYEKDFCVPGGHLWGSSYLYFNELANLIRGNKVSDMFQTELHRYTGSKESLPPDWEIHPQLGVLPRNYVKTEKVMRLFHSAKDFLTRLVKEYETVVKIARTLGEEIEFSEDEVRDMVNTELRNAYPGRAFKSITQEEKCLVAVRMSASHGLSPKQLSKALFLSELTIQQALRSKDYSLKAVLVKK